MVETSEAGAGRAGEGNPIADAGHQRRLFRAEAAQHQRERLFGAATLAMPASYAVVTGFLAAAVASLACFAVLGSYARREHVSGFLISSPGAAKIMPPRPGTVASVHVAEGDAVVVGTPLLTIIADSRTAVGQDANGTKLVALREQRDRLQEQVDLAARKAAMAKEALTADIARLGAEIDALAAKQRVQAERVQVANQEMEQIVAAVAKGYISLLEQQRRRDGWLAQQQSEEEVAGEILAKRGELVEKQNAMQRLPVDTADQTSRLKAATAEIDIKLIEIGESQGYLLIAPIAGRVSALQAWVGKVVEPTIPQLTIVPDGAVLVAELLVPARAIGFVAPGETVRVSYDTFPYQQFGFAEGVVSTVSHTLLKPDELVGPIQLTEPSYRIGVALQHSTISAYGQEIPLQADMQLHADILVQRRSLLAWIFDPLLSAWRNGR